MEVYIPCIVSALLFGHAFAQNVTTSQPSDPCSPGGSCLKKSVSGICNKCQCSTGFSGDYCKDRLTKFDGSIVYNTTAAADQLSTNISAFEEVIRKTVPGFQTATVTLLNFTTSQSTSVKLKFVVYLDEPAGWPNVNLSTFANEQLNRLTSSSVTNSVFSPSTGVVISSSSADVDECMSQLVSCAEHARCFNRNPGYSCICDGGWAGDGNTCTEVSCDLNKAPSQPSNGQRMIFLANGTDVTAFASFQTKMPYRTYIEYKCPKQYKLSIASSGKTQVDVTECVGTTKKTYLNSGWTGDKVSCNMDLQFTIAIVIAAISCVIIVLVGGGFIVSCNSKDKKKQQNEHDTEAYDSFE